MDHRNGLRDHLTGPHQVTPTDLADILRGHWSIENQLHWVRDMTYDLTRATFKIVF